MSFEYLEAAKALRKIGSGKTGMKTAIFDSKSRNMKRVYAMVMETTKYRAQIDDAVYKCGLKKKAQEQEMDLFLITLLVYELLYGTGKIKGGGQVKRLVVEHEAELRRLTGNPKAHIVPNAKPGENGNSAESKKPRYIRVNTLKTSVSKAINALCDKSQSTTGDALTSDQIEIVDYVPQVLKLPSNAHKVLSLHNHPLVVSGSIVLQDLASSLPAYVMLGEEEDFNRLGENGQSFDLIDACAAPGNKTSQLAALLHAHEQTRKLGKKKGTLYAFDRSEKRHELLSSRMTVLGASNVRTACVDFLEQKADDLKYKNVRGILLDPSCSGSGISIHGLAMSHSSSISGHNASSTESKESLSSDTLPSEESTSESAGKKRGRDSESSPDDLLEGHFLTPSENLRSPHDQKELERATTLAEFQTSAVIHALSYPQVRQVVYSTCSVYAIENEAVVSKVLRHFRESPAINESGAQVEVKLQYALRDWKRRGAFTAGLSKSEAACLIRCDPELDITTGFFVAKFVKSKI